MIKAKYEDRATMVSLLAKSFKENQSVNFIVRQDKNKLKRITALMEYSFDICCFFGEALLSNDRKGCVLILFPHLKQTNLRSIWLDITLIFRAIGFGGIPKALKREWQIKKLQPKENMIYLWFIGVDPLHQHNGIGGNLLKEIISTSNSRNLPVYLETSTIKNISWYEGFGFKIYNKLELGYTLFFLKREPDK